MPQKRLEIFRLQLGPNAHGVHVNSDPAVQPLAVQPTAVGLPPCTVPRTSHDADDEYRRCICPRAPGPPPEVWWVGWVGLGGL